MQRLNGRSGETSFVEVRLGLVALASALSIVVGCGDPLTEGELRSAQQEVVYGTDNRVEVYAEPSERLAQVARESTLALILNRRLSRQADGSWLVASPTAAERHGLCADEPFALQPAAADCSATLIAEDLAITAGHCVWSISTCRSYALVFNYLYAAPNELAVIHDNAVYQCKELVFLETTLDGDAPVDLAVVRLDRPVVGFRSVAIAPSNSVALGAPVVLVGTTEGVPIKIDRGGSVQSYVGRLPTGFKANLDAFIGSSGSGVYSVGGQLIGVLSNGQDDFQSAGGCRVTRSLADTAGGESSFWAEIAINRLCSSNVAPASLCGEPVEASEVIAKHEGDPADESPEPSTLPSRGSGCSLAVADHTRGWLFGWGFCCGLWVVGRMRRHGLAMEGSCKHARCATSAS